MLPANLNPAEMLLDRVVAPPTFVINPFFPCGELTEIVGAHGHFKSTIALDLCLAVATGRPWGGCSTARGRTAFITLEDSTDTLARRVRAWRSGICAPSEIAAADALLRADFAYLARDDAQGLVLTSTSRDGVTTAETGVADRVAELVRGRSLVVLETASRIHSGPETNDAFAALVRSLERITRAGPAVVIVRHVSKLTASKIGNGEEVTSYAGRGGSALSDAARSVLVVTRHDGAYGSVTLTAAKTTHAAPGEVISWMPVLVKEVKAIRLAPDTPELRLVRDADLLFAFVASREEGITQSWLHKHPPRGLTRNRALAALDHLDVMRRLESRKERRGKNKQLVDVFYARRPGDEVAA